jgi:4-hydroxy-3-methylbut-2-enyl diphosphate reductase
LIVLIGNPKHVEVQGIAEDLPSRRYVIVNEAAEVVDYNETRIGIISQTTIPDDVAEQCRTAVANRNPDASIRWINTICRPTRQRQNAIDKLCQQVSVVIVVGGENSNNTRRLVQRCQANNIPAHHVQSASQLDVAWLAGHARIGLTAGTSTPDETIDDVQQELVRLTSAHQKRMHRDQTWCHEWNNRQWADYFRDNMNHPPAIRWSDTPELSPAERKAVIASIQTFQLGESGEGRHICWAAQNWIDQGGDAKYLTALKLFLQEENCHAAWLGKFLEQEGEPLLQEQWSNQWFRRIRQLAGLRTSVMVLLTAEILAQVYYLALLRATDSQSLQAICQRILRDERSHVVFQQNQANSLSNRWGKMRLATANIAETLGFYIARRIVWHDHRSVFNAAGMNWKTYQARTMRRWLAARRQRG